MPYYEGMVIKRVFYWHRVERIDQWNKEPQKDTYGIRTLISHKNDSPIGKKRREHLMEVGKWL